MKKGKSSLKTGANGRSNLAVTSALLASTVLGAGVVKQAQAQGAPTQDNNKTVQQSVPPQRFSIPAGPLETSLRAFEEATGLKMQIRIMTLRGLNAPAVEGTMTPEEALQRLLVGSGIVYRFPDASSVILMRGKGTTAGRPELEKVKVAGEAKAPVKVSSPKYTEPARDIPQTITVVSSEVMKEQGATSLRDVVRNVAGITMNAGEGGATPGDKFNIRGFSAASDMFVDGVRDVSGYSRESYNLEQVEVSKGPNSSVAGRGSTGGSINLVTKTPNLINARSGSIALGSADQRRATVDINQELGAFDAPNAAVRVNALVNQSGVAGNEVLENKSWGFSPSLTIGLGGPSQLMFAYNRNVQKNIPGYGIETFAGVPKYDTRKFYGLRSLDRENVQANQFNIRIDHQFGDFAHLRNQATRGRSQSDRIVTSAVPAPSLVNPDSARRSSKSHINDNTVLSNQTNLTANFSTGPIKHDVVTGFEYTRENSMFGRHLFTGTAPFIRDLDSPTEDADYHPGLAAQVTRRLRATSLGGYLFDVIKLSSKIELNGGARWDRYTPVYVDSASRRISDSLHVKPKSSAAVSGRAGLVVKPVEAGSVYASYGTSFNPSSENLSADALTINSDLPPEKTRSYEIGSKWELFKRRMLATVALFRTDKTNARTPDLTTPTISILSGKQRVEGGEASLTGDVTSALNVLASYSFLKSEYLQSNTAGQTGTGFLNVPKHSVSTWATYKVNEDLTVGGGARYQDKRLLRFTAGSGSTPDLRVWVPSYHTYDAMAAYRMSPSLSLQLNLYNMSDKVFYDSGRMWVPAAGRSVSVTTSVKF